LSCLDRGGGRGDVVVFGDAHKPRAG
jgi:hypothetical protein